MRRPWIEGAAFLAAHDRPVPPPFNRTARRPAMSTDIRFAILTANPHAKPVAFPDLNALARHIQRVRGLAGLELAEVEDLELQGDVEPRRGVSVYTLDAGNDRDRLIGHAYLDGHGREALQAALRRNRLVVADDDRQAA